MTRSRPFAVACLLLALLATSASAERAPRNVVLLIGDGMGFGHTTLARLSLGAPDATLAMDSMPVAGFLKTSSAGPGRGRGIITDSAAAATALATGHKTNSGMIGVLPDGRPVRTVLQAAAASGRATGMVTDVTVTHATLAAFATHVASRREESEIAAQFVSRGEVDVLLGGGESLFVPRSTAGSRRTDDRDLLAEARAAGHAVVRTREELQRVQGRRVLGLFAPNALMPGGPGPTLPELTADALQLLSRDSRGFFLLVENGLIDWTSHENDAPATVREMLVFDEAVRTVLQFARKRGDTLVIVTSDHETGGLSVVAPASGSPAEFRVAWGTEGHSGADVPLLAEGPGARLFSGVLDNTDVPRRIARLWRLRLDEPAPVSRGERTGSAARAP
ncbi:MAG TPA: alkaline phosphatase [Chthonomonadales bacterium]|nr:alkaline phosphatase [Chthonomonadales bacterium]